VGGCVDTVHVTAKVTSGDGSFSPGSRPVGVTRLQRMTRSLVGSPDATPWTNAPWTFSAEMVVVKIVKKINASIVLVVVVVVPVGCPRLDAEDDAMVGALARVTIACSGLTPGVDIPSCLRGW
jgi:hypothetical protein